MSSVKDILRREALNRRAALTEEERAQKSDAAIEHLMQTAVFQTAGTVAIYLPLKTELALDSLLKAATDPAQRFVAPRTLADNQMRFHEVTEYSTLERGFGNIMEPSMTSPVVESEDIDLFLVPLAACDQRGNRLGFGGGFYDRALANQHGFKLGVGFSVQLVEHIEREAHDVTLDGFISEDGVTYF